MSATPRWQSSTAAALGAPWLTVFLLFRPKARLYAGTADHGLGGVTRLWLGALLDGSGGPVSCGEGSLFSVSCSRTGTLLCSPRSSPCPFAAPRCLEKTPQSVPGPTHTNTRHTWTESQTYVYTRDVGVRPAMGTQSPIPSSSTLFETPVSTHTHVRTHSHTYAGTHRRVCRRMSR